MLQSKMQHRIIDSHQHFWRLARDDYGWLTPTLQPIYRDFLPHDLEPYLRALKIDGTILVQAAPTIEETYFLLDLAQQYAFILGVVGWVDMKAVDAPLTLTKLSKNAHFRGIRPMLQDIPAVDWILQEPVTPTLKKLEELELTFDALILPKHLPILNALARRYPRLKIVIDHGAKPAIKSKEFEPWASDLMQVAQCANVYCKLSGLLTEAEPHAAWEQLKPYVEHLFLCFGTKRIMWGSDFPVLNLVSDYRAWFTLCQNYVKPLGEEAYADVFGQVAAQFYGVSIHPSRRHSCGVPPQGER